MVKVHPLSLGISRQSAIFLVMMFSCVGGTQPPMRDQGFASQV
jgi:hypothetical protein